MNVIKPPRRAVSGNVSKTVFFAGSIEMGKAENWQDRLTEHLQDVRGIIYNPRRDDWNPNWEQSFENPNFYQQVNWELRTLDDADVIVMYFDPNTKSPITLLELGLYADSGRLIVCCPNGFWRKGNVEVVCEKYGVPCFNTWDAFAGYVKGILLTNN